MSWLVLVISGVLEAVWATALGKPDGFSRLVPSITSFVALIMSMAGLGFAMRTLPVGTAYAVWVGIGAVLTVSFAMITGTESISIMKVLLLTGIVGLRGWAQGSPLSAGQPGRPFVGCGRPSGRC